MTLFALGMALASVAQDVNTDAPADGFQFDYVTPFLNLGLIGVLFLMFIARKGIVPEWVLKQTEERHKVELASRDADLAELKRLLSQSTEVYNDQVVPALIRAVDVNREYVELLRHQADEPHVEAAPRPRRTRTTTSKTSR